MKLFLATANRHKVEEFARLFAEAGLDVCVCSAAEAGGMPSVDETEETFLENARLKARALREQVAPVDWVLADDSGLEVAALNGEPGVRSARYAGADATDADNRKKLLEQLEGIRGGQRRARFVCVLVLHGPNGREEVFKGSCPGRIAENEKGEGGFGYDPIFLPEGSEETFAEIDPARKDRVSHRGKALRELADWIRKFRQ
jgi:XTP/dITP diphosphohydrolase